MSNECIIPFNKLPLFMQQVVLIVGVQGTKKHALAKSIVELSTSAKLQCRTATSLPLPAEHSDERPRIDLIVFVINSTNRESYTEVEKSLQHVDRRYFIGKVCFVAIRVAAQSEFVDVESITQLADDHASPVFWIDSAREADRTVVAKKVLHMLDISSGMLPGISPLLIDSTRMQHETQVL